MPNTSAHSLLSNVWGDRGYPVDPVWIANRLGIDVIESVLDNKISGALIKEPEEDPVIILNKNDSNARKRFTCAHELGHYIQRTENAKGGILDYHFIDYRGESSTKGTDADEIFANKFAACLLMPEDEVKKLIEKNYYPVLLSSYFGVSDDAINYRLANLGMC